MLVQLLLILKIFRWTLRLIFLVLIQLVIDKFFKKQEDCFAFVFDYDVNEHAHLTRFFLG